MSKKTPAISKANLLNALKDALAVPSRWEALTPEAKRAEATASQYRTRLRKKIDQDPELRRLNKEAKRLKDRDERKRVRDRKALNKLFHKINLEGATPANIRAVKKLLGI